MEASLECPSTESFSYSWLTNPNPSPPISAVDQDNSFIEMDPRLPPSRRFIRVSSDFAFDFPVHESRFGPVYADDVISNGFLVPLFLKDAKTEGHDGNCMPADETTSSSSLAVRRVRVGGASLRRCQMVSKRLLRKYLGILLRPFFCSNVRVRVGVSRSWELSAATSPRTSVAYSLDDNWRRSCDSESSIYEAVLHCKRTQGK